MIIGIEFLKKYWQYILLAACLLSMAFVLGVERPKYRKVNKQLKESEQRIDSLRLEYKAIELVNFALITRLDSSGQRQAKYDSAKTYIHEQIILQSDIDTTVGLDSLAKRLSDAAIRAYNL